MFSTFNNKTFNFFGLADIVTLLQWRRLDKEKVLEALECLLKVSPDEVVKVVFPYIC